MRLAPAPSLTTNDRHTVTHENTLSCRDCQRNCQNCQGPRTEHRVISLKSWNATKYNTTASFVYSDAYTAPILDLLNAQSGEKIVDFGCGTGELTKLLTNIVGVNGTVLGLDASENMVRSLNL